MSESISKVDVLAVLDVMHNHAAEWLDARSANGQLSNERRDHRVSLNSEARAAVAELMATVSMAANVAELVASGEKAPEVIASGMAASLRAALARCGVQA